MRNCRVVLLILTALVSMLMVGCSVLQTYPGRMQDTRQDLIAGKMNAAIKDLPKPASYDTDIANLELGRIQQLSGQYQQSLDTYNLVIQHVESQQLQAKLRVSAMLENMAAVLVNDNVIPYSLSGYQIVLLYQYQAYNYLALGNFQNALVMLRKAQLEQSFLLLQHNKEMAEAAKVQNKQAFKIKPQDYPAQYNAMMAASSSIKNSFDNPLSNYFASLLYYSSGDLNNAIVSLKNALQGSPDNPYLRSALLTDLTLQGTDNELAQYMKAFGVANKPIIDANQGTLAVIYEQGLIPAMQEVKVPIPIGSTMLMVAFPYYDSDQFPNPISLKLEHDGKILGNSMLLTNNALLAQKALAEDYPLIILRAVLRLSAQAGTAMATDRNNNQLGSIAVLVYSIFTGHADLRSWLSLPDNVQIFQGQMAAGAYDLIIGQQSISATINAGRITLIWVVNPGTKKRSKVFNL